MSTTYHAKARKPAKKNPADRTLLIPGLFSQENGDPFTLLDETVLATAITLLVYHHLMNGTFGNNLACLRCGKCALSISRETLETAYVECRKCFRKERFIFQHAYEFYMTMVPEKVRRSHATDTVDAEDEDNGEGVQEAVWSPSGRTELPML